MIHSRSKFAAWWLSANCVSQLTKVKLPANPMILIWCFYEWVSGQVQSLFFFKNHVFPSSHCLNTFAYHKNARSSGTNTLYHGTMPLKLLQLKPFYRYWLMGLNHHSMEPFSQMFSRNTFVVSSNPNILMFNIFSYIEASMLVSYHQVQGQYLAFSSIVS